MKANRKTREQAKKNNLQKPMYWELDVIFFLKNIQENKIAL